MTDQIAQSLRAVHFSEKSAVKAKEWDAKESSKGLALVDHLASVEGEVTIKAETVKEQHLQQVQPEQPISGSYLFEAVIAGEYILVSLIRSGKQICYVRAARF
jgi:hypothetical protein